MNNCRTQEVVHTLKTWPQPFEAVLSFRKTHEIRVNDRDFTEGDILVLQEFDPDINVLTGREITCRITYVTSAGSFGLPNDLCVMSIKIEHCK